MLVWHRFGAPKPCPLPPTTTLSNHEADPCTDRRYEDDDSLPLPEVVQEVPEPSLAELWAGREVSPWEAKQDVDLRMSDGSKMTVVVRDLPNLIDVVGRENCF